MEQRSDQALSGVELQIWREESGEWRCQVLAPEPAHTVMLGDQAALSSYIAGQIDWFIKTSYRPSDKALDFGSLDRGVPNASGKTSEV